MDVGEGGAVTWTPARAGVWVSPNASIYFGDTPPPSPYPDGEEVVRRIEELRDFDERLNLDPREIILGRAAWRALRLFHMFNYNERLPELFTFGDLPVTSLPPGSDPWRVEVRSVGVGL